MLIYFVHIDKQLPIFVSDLCLLLALAFPSLAFLHTLTSDLIETVLFVLPFIKNVYVSFFEFSMTYVLLFKLIIRLPLNAILNFPGVFFYHKSFNISFNSSGTCKWTSNAQSALPLTTSSNSSNWSRLVESAYSILLSFTNSWISGLLSCFSRHLHSFCQITLKPWCCKNSVFALSKLRKSSAVRIVSLVEISYLCTNYVKFLSCRQSSQACQ